MALSQPILSTSAKEAVKIIESQAGGRWVNEEVPVDAVNRAIRAGVLNPNGSGYTVDWDVAQADPSLRHLDES